MRVLSILLTPLLFAAVLVPLQATAAEQSGSVGATPANTANEDAEIVLYVLPNCGYCEKARQLLTRHDLPWREVDIASSSAGKKRFLELGGVGTPLLVVGGDTLQGFDSVRIESLLAQHGAIAP